MKVLYTNTLAISTDKVPTIGQILSTLNKLKKTFEIKEDDNAFVNVIKAILRKDIRGRYQDEHLQQFLEQATALDTTCKTKMLASEDVWNHLIVKVADLLCLLETASMPEKIKPDPDAPESAPETELAHDDEPAAATEVGGGGGGGRGTQVQRGGCTFVTYFAEEGVFF